MTGDQQPADLHDLPFDQYQRYRIIGEVLSLLAAHDVLPANGHPPTILDVGGYPGLLPRFVDVPGAQVTVLDVVRDTTSAHHYGYTYLMGSGMALPFPDHSFDCVVSLDTLEHIPAEARPTFLAEMRRVARDAAVLICPIFREETALAEQTLFEYIRWLLKARQEQLDEHITYGLPDFPAAQAGFDGAGWSTLTFPAGNLYTWLLMMVAKHYLLSLHDEGAAEIERRLDRFFNLTLSAHDRQEPAYRAMLVATAAPQPAALAAIAAQFPAVPAAVGDNLQRMELVQLLLRLFDLRVANHEDAALREQLTHRERHAQGLEDKVALLEQQRAGAAAAVEAVPVLQQTVTDLNEAVNYLRLEVAQRDTQLVSRALEVAQRDTQLVRYNAQLAAMEADRDRLASEATALRSALEQERAEAQERHQYIARLQADLEQKNQHILYLEQLLQKIEAGQVLRMTRRLTRLVGK
jgi:SAM-dependent methyltransferase